HALEWQAPGPIRNRGQKETGHHRGDVAEKKLVGVPSNCAVTGGEVPETGEKSNPQHHGDAGPQRRTEEERPEAVTQQRDCLRPKSGNTARPGTAVFAHPTSPVPVSKWLGQTVH